MRITILAPGSQGDVQPLVALGTGLQAAGYQVRVATHSVFEALVNDSSLEFFPVHVNPMEMAKSELGKEITNPSGILSLLLDIASAMKKFEPLMKNICSDFLAACQSGDAIIYSPFSFLFGPHIAESLNMPAVAAYNVPLYRTRDFPYVIFQRDLGVFNQLTWTLPDIIVWFLICTIINKWRKEVLTLPPIPIWTNYRGKWYKEQKLVLFGFSPSVVPKPSDWGNHIHITGYWFLNNKHHWQPPADLADFLAAGPPPVYVGFGSMATRNPEETASTVIKALTRSKQRGILAMGWGGMNRADLPENVFKVDFVPHDWLFPQMSAVVHHGAAGTTAAGLRAGVPSIIVPFSFDHPFWGKRVADLGAGPPPLPRKNLSVERLASAITRAVSDREMRKKALIIGKSIQAEDGVGRAVELINRYLSSYK